MKITSGNLAKILKARSFMFDFKDIPKLPRPNNRKTVTSTTRHPTLLCAPEGTRMSERGGGAGPTTYATPKTGREGRMDGDLISRFAVVVVTS